MPEEDGYWFPLKRINEIGLEVVRKWRATGIDLDPNDYDKMPEDSAYEELDEYIVAGLRRLSKAGVSDPVETLHRWMAKKMQSSAGKKRRLLEVIYIRTLDNTVSLGIYKGLRRSLESGLPRSKPVWTESESGQRMGMTPYQQRHGIDTVGAEFRHHREKLIRRGLIKGKR